MSVVSFSHSEAVNIASCKSNSPEDLHAPARHGSENTWAQVPGWVDSIARVEAHGQADDQDYEAHGEGLESLGDGVVVRIHNGQDAYDQGCRSDELYGGRMGGRMDGAY